MVKKCEEVYATLEKILNGNDFIAGNEITIADFSYVTTLSNLSVGLVISKFLQNFNKFSHKHLPYIQIFLKFLCLQSIYWVG